MRCLVTRFQAVPQDSFSGIDRRLDVYCKDLTMTGKANEPWAAWVEQAQKWMGNPAAVNPFGSPTSPFGAAMAGFPNPFTSGAAGNPLDPQSIMKAIDPAEIERRIGDMRAVEAWLKFSLSTIEVTIKTMEMQRNAYASLNKMNASVEQSARAGAEAMAQSMKSMKPVRRAARGTKSKR
jgi:hypothetical protein